MFPRMKRAWLLAFIVACGGVSDGDDAGIDAATFDATSDVVAETSAKDATNDALVDGGADASDAADASSQVDATFDAAADAADASDAAIEAPSCADFDAQACAALPQSALVNVMCASVAPPAGGTIVDGYYLLTSALWNTAKDDGGCAVTTQTRRDTMIVCGTYMQILDFDENNNKYAAGLSFSTNGTTLTTTHICGGIGGTYPYTATATTISLYVDYSQTAELVLTLTKQ